MTQAGSPEDPMADSKTPIDDLAEFLAHALELAQAGSSYYEEIADSMELHHNAEIAGLFRRLQRLSAERAAAFATRSAGVELPRIPPWGFHRHGLGGEDCGDYLAGEVSYEMTCVQALELVLQREACSQAFFLHQAAASRHVEVQRLATEIGHEAAQHLRLLQRLLGRERRRLKPRPADLDPPHVPA
jgi:hypothetical protein